MSSDKKSFLIVGLGRLGTMLCERLAELGQSVIGVDSRPEPVMEMADKIDVAAQVDVADEASLVKAGAKEVDVAIVTIGEAVENSILCTSILVDLGVPIVIARAANKLHARVLERVGAHKVIMPESDIGRRLADNLVYPWYSDFKQLDGGNFVFGKIAPTPDMIGHTIAELHFSQRYQVIIVLMEFSDGSQEFPHADRPFEKDDKLWIIGRRKFVDKVIDKKDVNPTESL